MGEEINKLRERVARGEFRFGDTLKLKLLEKVEASKRQKNC